jgi:iron complex outermembrane receptor protein
VDLSVNKKTSDFKQPYFDTPDSFGAGFLTGPGRSDLDGQTISFNPKWKTMLSNGGHVVLGWDVSKAEQSGSSYFGPAAQQLILANQGPGKFVENIVTDQQSVTLNNSAIYATSQMPVNETVNAHLGWRSEVQKYASTDINKASGTQTSAGKYSANAYEAGLNFKVGLASRYFARVNHSFRFANTDEYWGLDPVLYSRVFSGELRPQFTQAYEVGYERSADSHHGSLIASQSTTQDEIRYNPSYYRNSNLSDDVLRRSLVGTYAYTTPSGSKISLTARLQQAEFANGLYKGQALGLVPATIYTASLIQPLDAFSKLGLSVMRVSEQNYDIAPDKMDGKDKMPAFTRADLFWTHQHDKLEYKVTIKNLLNAVSSNYGGFAFVQSPGATGSSTYYYFPSDPRSFHLGVTYRF